MSYAIFDYVGAFLRSSFAHYPRDQNKHVAAPVKVAKQQTTPELSGTFRTLPPEPTPTRAGTLQNPPEPSETFHSGTYLLNLRQHTPEPSEIFRNLPPEPTPFYTRTLRNLPEPASGTYTPAHAGTLRNLPEPSSGVHLSPSVTYQVGSSTHKRYTAATHCFDGLV